MVKHNGAISTNLEIEKTYDAIYYYFNAIGFKVVNEAKPTRMMLERGSIWMSDGSWKTKLCKVDLFLSNSSHNSTLIRCEYDISGLLWEGKKDIENIEMEIQGLKNLLESSHSKTMPSEKERICVDCKKDIPWDALLCPYCGKNYKEIANKTDTKKVIQPKQKNAKYCTECRYKLEGNEKYCPDCGNKL